MGTPAGDDAPLSGFCDFECVLARRCLARRSKALGPSGLADEEWL